MYLSLHTNFIDLLISEFLRNNCVFIKIQLESWILVSFYDSMYTLPFVSSCVCVNLVLHFVKPIIISVSS